MKTYSVRMQVFFCWRDSAADGWGLEYSSVDSSAGLQETLSFQASETSVFSNSVSTSLSVSHPKSMVQTLRNHWPGEREWR